MAKETSDLRALEANATHRWAKDYLLVLPESWPTAVGSQEQGHSEPRSRRIDRHALEKKACQS